MVAYSMELLKKWMLLILQLGIVILFFATLSCSNLRLKLLNTISILFGMSGLLQLEISGLFDKLKETLNRAQQESGSDICPTHMIRPLFNYPIKNDRYLNFQYCLFTNKKVGFYLSMTGLLLQGIITWVR